MATGERLLVFGLGGRTFAIELKDVAEVMEPAAIFPVPRAPHWLKGAMNFHGDILAVVDPAVFLGWGRAAPSGRFLVLDSGVGSFALWVDWVERVIGRDCMIGEEPGGEFPVDVRLLTENGEAGMLAVRELLRRLDDALARI